MKLLPTEQTNAQLQALRKFCENGSITLHEPCDCGFHIRHNNGGNYHRIVSFRMDGGKCWRSQTITGDYAKPDDWEEVSFGKMMDEIVELSALGW